jgi:hypothetical protein
MIAAAGRSLPACADVHDLESVSCCGDVKEAVADAQVTTRYGWCRESTRHLQHDLSAPVWSTSEHLVSCAHVGQRQDGPDLWDDFATFEQC